MQRRILTMIATVCVIIFCAVFYQGIRSLASSGEEQLKFKYYTQAVSYTHLDVYKRQAYRYCKKKKWNIFCGCVAVSYIARNADFLHGGLEGNFPGNDQMKMRGLKKRKGVNVSSFT